VNFIAEFCEPGNRKDLIEAGCGWLFEDHPEEVTEGVNDIEYADTITSDATFRKKIHTFFGESDGQLASLTEWNTEEEVENPEITALEIGDTEDGGFIRVFFGCIVKKSEIEIMEI